MPAKIVSPGGGLRRRAAAMSLVPPTEGCWPDAAVVTPVADVELDRCVARLAWRWTCDSVRVSCGELAESFGDRVDGRLAGGNLDHEVVDGLTCDTCMLPP